MYEMKLGLNEILSFSFKGRACRLAYWRTLIVLMLLSFVGGVVFGALAPFEITSTPLRMVVLALAWGYYLTLAAWLVSAVVRRLHDINYSGTAALFLIIPGLQFIMLFVLGLWSGKKGLNRFGPDPLAVMTLGDAAPVKRRERTSNVRPSPRRVVKETATVEVLDPDQTAPRTTPIERMDAAVEDWAKVQFDETAAKLDALPPEAHEAREAQKAVLRETFETAQREGRLTPEAFARWVKLLEAL